MTSRAAGHSSQRLSHERKLNHCAVDVADGHAILSLTSADATNKLASSTIQELLGCVTNLRIEAEAGRIRRLIIAGNEKFFSAGADLNEIAQLTGPEAFEFSRLGQKLMLAIDDFPVPVIAAIRGYCMGGGMDLALACDYRIASPDAVFGHRGASLGLMTGWGGTQRLPRLIGKARAMQMFILAEMVKAEAAKKIGLVDEVANDPFAAAMNWGGVASCHQRSGLRFAPRCSFHLT
jgi:enoyl-CoA hydratase